LLRGSELLAAMKLWIEVNVVDSSDANLASELAESPVGRNPRSVRWIVTRPDTMGQMIVWEDGQVELDLAGISSGRVISEHHQVDSREDLWRVLDRVRGWGIR
jgi:hypothetical protein